jgi:hypothetical protein
VLPAPALRGPSVRPVLAILLSLALVAAAVPRAAAQDEAPPVSLDSLALAPASVTGGQGASGSVRLSAAAPAGGLTVTLTSSYPAAAQAPAEITVPEGASTASFPITTGPVLLDSRVTLTATLADASRSAVLTVRPPALAFFLLGPRQVRGGTTVLGRVVLGCTAPAGGTLVTLASNNTSIAAVPATVLVPAGSTTVAFPVATTPVPTPTEVTLIASLAGTFSTARLLVQEAPSLSLRLTDASVCAPTTSAGVVTVPDPAPEGGETVDLTSDNPAVATVPASVTVEAGQTSATFPVTIAPGPGSAGYVGIAATLGDATARDGILVLPGGMLTALDLAAPVLCAGRALAGTVRLQCPAPAGGTVIGLSSSGSAAQVPGSITVPEGAITASFPISAPPNRSEASIEITATLGCLTQTAELVVRPESLTEFTLSAARVCARSPLVGMVTLSCPAPAGGSVVSLSSSNVAAVVVPAELKVPAGATMASFPITSLPVAANTAVTLKAGFAGGDKALPLTVEPLLLSALTLEAASACGGSTPAGKVALSCGAPADGVVVALTSSNPAVAAVPASVTIQPGSTSASFPIIAQPVAADGTATLKATFGSVSKTAMLKVLAIRLTTLTLSASSVKGGSPLTGSVTLSCPARAGGVVVTLASSNKARAVVPANVTVPAGSATATFPITTAGVTSAANVTVTASYLGTKQVVGLKLLP